MINELLGLLGELKDILLGTLAGESGVLSTEGSLAGSAGAEAVGGSVVGSVVGSLGGEELVEKIPETLLDALGSVSNNG
ncbi:hypothetical protein [Corynebacterium kalidii]|uniref:Uncharacterized protein n=1 Tax=Corynebacterium kalidii TaxID=2931982 RepID=A0A9X1WFW2_9CORY|nr:hypothetical protein [Corynebacterium kalidii]MCJ7858289.1 hypothetical protein [Corynebacterium kalidii]